MAEVIQTIQVPCSGEPDFGSNAPVAPFSFKCFDLTDFGVPGESFVCVKAEEGGWQTHPSPDDTAMANVIDFEIEGYPTKFSLTNLCHYYEGLLRSGK